MSSVRTESPYASSIMKLEHERALWKRRGSKSGSVICTYNILATGCKCSLLLRDGTDGEVE